MSYDWEHDGNPARVHKILERLRNGETTDQIFGTHCESMQQIEDLMSGMAYQYPDKQERQNAQDQIEQKQLEEELRKFAEEYPDAFKTI